MIVLAIISLILYLRLTDQKVKFQSLSDEYLKLVTIEDQKIEKPEVQKLFPSVPLCQFCKDPLVGKVTRSIDGYWCCYNCSILKFGARRANKELNG